MNEGERLPRATWTNSTFVVMLKLIESSNINYANLRLDKLTACGPTAPLTAALTWGPAFREIIITRTS